MIAIVAGATGLTGSHLLKILLSDARFSRVITVGRRPSGLKSEKLEEIIFPQLAELPLNDARLRGDVYFCCLGTTIKKAGSQAAFRQVDYDSVVRFASVAEAQGARGFALVSAMGANSKSAIFYNRVKGEAEEAVLKLKIPRMVIYRPSLLLGERQEFRLGENISIHVVNALYPMLPGPLRRLAGTPVKELAALMVRECLEDAPTHKTISAGDIHS